MKANGELPSLIVMGVSSSGKSTIGALMSERLGVPFIDGDDLHPDENKEKMRSGIALNDADRFPWLHRIGQLIDAGRVEGHATIVACSALKRSYRDILREHAPDLIFVHLTGSRALIEKRMKARHHEYMPTSLLDSQFATLEPLERDERKILVPISLEPDEMVHVIISAINRLTRNTDKEV
ncbi:gluconokinase [Paramicrobacterium agarici]|uniref:Gluconokinase n=1 Tax=Paramicrobacterium agarici TaxID=630514 RepID=A0A2A9E0T6_9MICO|nr:gluconokinase [Microbacterium agarici]PFG31809.1 gluconokinase [Microbacterium agarici]TQO21706.1 gluconokinase [Microbacterium agarici]